MPANLRPNSFTFGFREAASQRRKLSESSGKNTKFTAKNPLWEETLEQKSPERESLSACEFLEENDEHSVLDHSTKFFVREVEVSPSEFEGCWQDYTKISGEKAAQPLLEPDSPDFQQRSAQAGLHQNSIVKLSLPATANQDGNMCRSCMGLPIISPMDRQYSVWRWLVLSLDATYAAFVIPMTILLEPTYHGALDWLDVMSIVSMTVYVADILVGFNVAWVAVSQDLKKVLVVDPNKIVKFYLRKSFTVDLLTASPYVLEVLLEIIGLAMPLPLWCLVAAPWIRGLRIMRLIRARHLFRLDFLAKVTSRVSPAVSTLVMLMYFVAFLVNILGCLWYFIGVQNGMEDSWMTSKFLISWVEVEPGSWETAEVPLMDSGFVPKYISALYWTTTTLTTVGFGDIVPQNILEMLISIFVEFLGVVIFGLLINSLANVFMINSKEARRAQAVQDRISEADEWMLMKRVRKDIRTKVRNYFTDIWARQLSVKDERNLLEDLPYHLRAEVAMSILSESLQEAPQTLLSTLPEAIQRLIVVGMVPHTILGNHSLSHEGQPCESMWLLHSGEMMTIYRYRVTSVQRAPHFLGYLEMVQVLLEADRTKELRTLCGYRALSLCNVWEIRFSELLRLVDAFPAMRDHALLSARSYLDACVANPLPFQEFNNLYQRILVSVQQSLPTTLHQRQMAAPEWVSPAVFFEDMDLIDPSPQNLSKLRNTEIRKEVIYKLRMLLERQRMTKPEGFGKWRPWKRLSWYVTSGGWRHPTPAVDTPSSGCDLAVTNRSNSWRPSCLSPGFASSNSSRNRFSSFTEERGMLSG